MLKRDFGRIRIPSPEFLIALAAVAALAGSAQGLTLVRDGEATSVIIRAREPTLIQRHAAHELAHHLRAMSGATVPIVSEPHEPAPGVTPIYVGPSEATAALGVDLSDLPPETFIVQTVGGALVLAGDDAKSASAQTFFDNVHAGTLFAVYDFLQDQLGCRWLWPGPTGMHIPRRSTIEVGDLAIRETPKLIRRHFRVGVRADARDYANRHYPRTMRAGLDTLYNALMIDERAWLRRMRMGQSDKPQYGHAFTRWYDRHFVEHPEIFALQTDGRRGLPVDSYPAAFVKMCVSSDRLVDMLIDEFLEQRAQNPRHRWLNACENDGGLGFCVCAPCRALDLVLDDEVRQTLRARGWTDAQIEKEFAPGENGLPNNLSNRYFHFYNRLGRRLAEVAPDAYVVAYAYAKYRFAPIGLRVEPNVLVGLIGFNNYPMRDDEHQRELAEARAWRDAGVEALFFRPNSFYFSVAHGVPWDATTQMAGDFRELLAGGLMSTDFDRLNGHWSTAARTYYVMARQHWDTEAAVDELKREFAEGFGPAAEVIDEYYDHWEAVFHVAHTRPDLDRIVKAADDFGGHVGLRKALPVLLTDDDFEQGRTLLDRATALAGADGDDVLVERIEILRLGLEHGALMREGARFAVDRHYAMPVRYEEHWPTVERVYAVRSELGRRRGHNVFWLNNFELSSHDPYATRMYYDFEGRSYRPLMTPPRDDWKFIPDPEGAGEKEGWYAQRMTPARALYGFEYPSYRHLFYSTWDGYQPVRGWKRRTGHDAVVNGWYQIEFAISKADLDAGGVLYFPYIHGAAKIWIGDQLVRETGAAEGSAELPITIDPSRVGIEADRAFRLTIRVHSPDEPGGLIGPVYVARASERVIR